jgi:hypothetical protein
LILLLLSSVVLGMEPRALLMLDKHSITELQPQTNIWLLKATELKYLNFFLKWEGNILTFGLEAVVATSIYGTVYHFCF